MFGMSYFLTVWKEKKWEISYIMFHKIKRNPPWLSTHCSLPQFYFLCTFIFEKDRASNASSAISRSTFSFHLHGEPQLVQALCIQSPCIRPRGLEQVTFASSIHLLQSPHLPRSVLTTHMWPFASTEFNESFLNVMRKSRGTGK